MRIRVHPTLYVYLMSMALLTSWDTCAGAASALFVHEIGHLTACCMAGDSIEILELTPFGGMMTYGNGKAPSKGVKGICIAAAGPAANYLLLLAASFFPELFVRGMGRSIVSSNAAMLCLNLLPVLPLDGGRILFCMGYYVFPVFRLIHVLSLLGVAAGAGLLLLAFYGVAALGCLNCSLVIIGVYLIYCAWKCRTQYMTENLFSILHEREEGRQGPQPVRVYRVSGDMRLLSLVPLLGGAGFCEFICMDEKHACRISEEALCRKLLEQPLLSIKEAFME